MQHNVANQFSFDFRQILIDEIALEGLEGIDIDLLWRRVEKRISSPLTDKMKKRYWDFIASSPSLSFYELSQPVPYLEIKDRFTIIDEESGNLKDPEDFLDGPYEYKPVENEFGSCAGFNDRRLIKDISLLSYEDVILTYNRTLVIVASKEERFRALAPHIPYTVIASLTPLHYCLLELIGRSRENGQMTVGKTNLMKINKDSKMLFYHRKYLKFMDAIRVTKVTQKIGDRGVMSNILRLRRFHCSTTMSQPKAGPIHNVVELLKTQENYSEALDTVIQKGVLAGIQRKRKYQKAYRIFEFSEKEVMIENKKKMKVPVKRRYISISTKSDSSSSSDEETNQPVLKCQYKVGVPLLRQAFLQLYKAGLKGLTQVELAQLLGTEFYTIRNICKILKSNKLVKEVYEDKGRQRTARLIVIGSGSANNVNVEYEEEWRKFLEYRAQYMLETVNDINKENPTTNTESFDKSDNMLDKDVDWHDIVTEMKKVEGLEGYDLDNISLLSSNKNLTLRQLKYANGIIKVLEEKLAVAGYQVLNNLVAADVGEAPMDTRAMKVLLQKLMTDGLVKIFKIKWPDQSKYTVYMCPVHVFGNHPIFKQKYKEILDKIYVSKDTGVTKQISKSEGNKSLSRYFIPRFFKVRKFHEFIFDLAYCNDAKKDSKLPVGFEYLNNVIPEMTLEFALGNINLYTQINLTNKQVSDNVNTKLKDLPREIALEIMYANTFRNSLRENLRVLAFFGLIQIINQPVTVSFDTIMYFVNRHPKIVDTSGVWPRADVDISTLEYNYYLGNMEDVFEFWNSMFQISSNTKITLEKREACRIKPPVRVMDEVRQYDNGERLGDGNGPCGYDSSLYLDVPRLWHQNAPAKQSSKPIKKPVQIPKLTKKKLPIQKKKPNIVVDKEKYKTRVRELKEFKIPIFRGKKQVMINSGVWSNLDDLIISLAKVAYTIMNPTTQAGSFRLRNIVVKEIFSINDPAKTSAMCHLRASLLDQDSKWAYEKQHLLNEFSKRRTLCKKYEGLLKKLKLRNSANISKYFNEAKLAMMELIWILLQITRTESYKRRTPCVATSTEDFHNKYSIRKISDNKAHNLYNMPNATDAETTLKECVLLTVAMSYNREVPINIAKKIYVLFKTYPERLLRKSIDELRKCQAISAKEKLSNSKVNKMNFQDLVESAYKLSAGYYRRWICKLNAEFLDAVIEAFALELPAEELKGGSGINCYCLELESEGLLEVSPAHAPQLIGGTDSFAQEDNVYGMDTNYKLKSGTVHVRSKTNDKKIFFENSELEEFWNEIQRNALITYPLIDVDTEQDDIVSFLKDKQESGASFAELQEFTKCDTKSLFERLIALESKHFIKRVGFYDNRIVHIMYAKSWAMTIDNNSFLPSPWITLHGTVRHELFFKWANVILYKVFEHPGISIQSLCQMCELITAKSVQDICIFLMRCECVRMHGIKCQVVDLFSDDDCVEELTAYNPYESPKNIIVFPTKTVLTKYASIRKYINLYKSEEKNC